MGRPVRIFSRAAVAGEPDVVTMDVASVDVDLIAKALKGCDAVVHLAGANEVAMAADPDASLAQTIAAARRVSLAAAQAGVGRFVYLSTIHVYGAALDRGGRVDERTIPEPRHPYAVARLASEHLASAAGVDQLVVLRLTNSVGAPATERVERWTLVANELCRQAAAGDPLRLRSSGRQWRDFIDLGDVCRTIAASAIGSVPPGTYNLGSGQARTVLDLAGVIADVTGELIGTRPVVDAPPLVGEPPPRIDVDVSRLLQHVDAPTTPIEASVRELVEFCRAASWAKPTNADG